MPSDPEEATPDEAEEGTPAEPDPSSALPPRPSAVLRYLFHLVWLFAAPLALSLATVWALTPTSRHVTSDWLRNFVGEQQVPATILFFTLFAMVLWRLRYHLPLAAAAGVLGRSDIAPRLRGRFDEAVQLVDEAGRILRRRRRQVERALSRTEREELCAALEALEDALGQASFDEERFDEAARKAEALVGEHLARWRKSELREYAESIGVAVAVALLLRVFVIEAFKIPSGSMVPTLTVGDYIFVAKYAYGPLLPWSDARLFSRLPPERGDVVVFKFPENKDQDFIKRVVALPRDKLEALDGRPVINGWLVPHCYVGHYGDALGLDEMSAGELYLEFLGDKVYLTRHNERPNRAPTAAPGDGEQPCRADEECGGPPRACRGGLCGVLQGARDPAGLQVVGPYAVAPGEVWVMGDNRNNSHDSRSWRGGRGGGVPLENIKGRAMFVWLSWDPQGGVATDRLFVNVMGSPKLPSGPAAALVAGVERCLRARPPPSQTTPPAPR